MLQADNLSVWRGFNCLFQDLCWAVPEGSALLVRGPNGAGKTTLLRIIVGLSDAESGRMLWHGAPLPESRRIRPGRSSRFRPSSNAATVNMTAPVASEPTASVACFISGYSSPQLTTARKRQR